MSKHIELATPCPNCQSRLTLSVRRTPLINLRAVIRSAFHIGVNMSARGFSPFLVSRQREGRRADST